MSKTKIDWADYTWNPITGCYHTCPYCYARKIANRFGNKAIPNNEKNELFTEYKEFTYKGYELVRQFVDMYDSNDRIAAYPFGFKPTFYDNRLTYPSEIEKSSNIFVGSMSDIFGEWIPNKWIKEIFDACERNPKHNYLFLTKNPKRYFELQKGNLLPNSPNFWFGTSVVTENADYFFSDSHNTFLSIEPIMSNFSADKIIKGINWIIVGAETGNRKGRIIPEKEWIDNISNVCKDNEISLFMKSSLKELMGRDFIQQMPMN